MKTIGVIVSFFGEWPRWGDFFLETCRRNPTVDFLLVTDCAVPPLKEPSANIKRIEMDLAGFKTLASERLGLRLDFKGRSKLCDLRPAFGVIFEEILRGYDFWGHCDVDMAFGDIREFMADELLESHDVITARKEFIVGHFTLYRNVDEVNRLYERSRDYPKVFTVDRHLSFGECGGGLQFDLLKGAAFADIAAQSKVDSLMHILMRSPEIRAHLETICDEYLPHWAGFGGEVQILWKNGKVTKSSTGEPLMYYHLNFLKDLPSFYVPHWEEMPDAFLMTHRGVFWIGEQPLGQRLANAVQRGLHFLATSVLMVKWKLVGRARELFRKRMAPSPASAR